MISAPTVLTTLLSLTASVACQALVNVTVDDFAASGSDGLAIDQANYEIQCADSLMLGCGAIQLSLAYDATFTIITSNDTEWTFSFEGVGVQVFGIATAPSQGMDCWVDGDSEGTPAEIMVPASTLENGWAYNVPLYARFGLLNGPHVVRCVPALSSLLWVLDYVVYSTSDEAAVESAPTATPSNTISPPFLDISTVLYTPGPTATATMVSSTSSGHMKGAMPLVIAAVLATFAFCLMAVVAAFIWYRRRSRRGTDAIRRVKAGRHRISLASPIPPPEMTATPSPGWASQSTVTSSPSSSTSPKPPRSHRSLHSHSASLHSLPYTPPQTLFSFPLVSLYDSSLSSTSAPVDGSACGEDKTDIDVGLPPRYSPGPPPQQISKPWIQNH